MKFFPKIDYQRQHYTTLSPQSRKNHDLDPSILSQSVDVSDYCQNLQLISHNNGLQHILGKSFFYQSRDRKLLYQLRENTKVDIILENHHTLEDEKWYNAYLVGYTITYFKISMESINENHKRFPLRILFQTKNKTLTIYFSYNNFNPTEEFYDIKSSIKGNQSLHVPNHQKLKKSQEYMYLGVQCDLNCQIKVKAWFSEVFKAVQKQRFLLELRLNDDDIDSEDQFNEIKQEQYQTIDYLEQNQQNVAKYCISNKQKNRECDTMRRQQRSIEVKKKKFKIDTEKYIQRYSKFLKKIYTINKKQEDRRIEELKKLQYKWMVLVNIPDLISRLRIVIMKRKSVDLFNKNITKQLIFRRYRGNISTKKGYISQRTIMDVFDVVLSYSNIVKIVVNRKAQKVLHFILKEFTKQIFLESVMNKCSKYIEFVNRIIKYYRWKNEEILQNSEMMMYKIIMLLKIDDKFDEAMPNKNKLSHYLKYMDKKLLLKEFVDSINAEYQKKWRKYCQEQENKEDNFFKTEYSLKRPKLLIFSNRKLLYELILSKLYIYKAKFYYL